MLVRASCLVQAFDTVFFSLPPAVFDFSAFTAPKTWYAVIESVAERVQLMAPASSLSAQVLLLYDCTIDHMFVKSDPDIEIMHSVILWQVLHVKRHLPSIIAGLHHRESG